MFEVSVKVSCKLLIYNHLYISLSLERPGLKAQLRALLPLFQAARPKASQPFLEPPNGNGVAPRNLGACGTRSDQGRRTLQWAGGQESI